MIKYGFSEVIVWQRNVDVAELVNGTLTRCVVTEIATLEQISVGNIKFAKSGKEIQMAVNKLLAR